VEEAVKKAFSAFHEEHGRYPVQNDLIVELLINPDVIRASVIEIPELADEGAEVIDGRIDSRTARLRRKSVLRP
jgi:hypothetical protein